MPLPAPIDFKARPFTKILAVADYETDPFLRDRIPRPYVLGFYDELSREFRYWWGDDCTQQFAAWLADEKKAGREYCVYMHNGGRFDFLLMMEQLGTSQMLSVVNGRIVKGFFAGHEFRDSWALFPQALKSYKKDEFDHAVKGERAVREQYKEECIRYLRGDCVYLFEIISPFVEEYGDVLTVGSVALRQLNSLYGFERLNADDDAVLRPFYFGGRVQCFELGDFNVKGVLVDANSMYPAAMKNARHPVSGFHNLRKITRKTAFARIRAKSLGCLPWRGDDGRLNFTPREGTFFATSHEIEAGLELGLLRIYEVEQTYEFDEWTDFGGFVDKFFALKDAAKHGGDKARELIYKRILNSAYGKFALDSSRFCEYRVAEMHIGCGEFGGGLRAPDNDEGWHPVWEALGFRIWERPTPGRRGRFLNVATAASITGAARANLMRNLAKSERPFYCDTDGIMCVDFAGDIDKYRLGAWDKELEFDRIAIGAKKIYACWGTNHDPKHASLSIGEYGCLKTASKGAKLSAVEIIAVANGKTVLWESEAPNLSFLHKPSFTKRRIKRADVEYEDDEELAA